MPYSGAAWVCTGIAAECPNSADLSSAGSSSIDTILSEEVTCRSARGASWNRNTFAGIENRYVLVAGVGNTWVDSEVSKFRTDYGLTYTRQEDVVENPNVKDSFAGLRLSYDYVRALTETTEFGSQLVFDDNLNNTEDFRAKFLNSLGVAISQKLALKTSLLLAYDNLPSLTTVPLFFPDGTPADEAVAVELDKLDTYFTVALVVKI